MFKVMIMLITGAKMLGMVDNSTVYDKLWLKDTFVIGPDSYGYICVADTNPDEFPWIDISAIGTEIIGLGDDNFVGPFPIGFDFPYYWYNVNQLWFCSNGVIHFSFPTALWTAYDAPMLPDPAQPNNMIVALGSDLTFEDTALTEIYYWTNNSDTFILQVNNVKIWTPYGDSGRYTFEVILTANGEITILYNKIQEGAYYSGAEPIVGIEDITGTVGLTYLYHNNPPAWKLRDTMIVKFIRPDTTSLEIYDLAIEKSLRYHNKICMLRWSDSLEPWVDVKNVGNQDITNFKVKIELHKKWRVGNAYNDVIILQDSTIVTDVVPSGSVYRVTFPKFGDWDASVPDYYLKAVVSHDSDIVYENNFASVEINLIDTTDWWRYDEDPQQIFGTSWIGAGSGWGARFVPLFYPATVESIGVFFVVSGSIQPGNAKISVCDIDPSTGLPGEELWSTTQYVSSSNFYVFNPNITIDSLGFFVTVIQLSENGPGMGLDTNKPVSREFYEYTGTWAPNRDKELEDPYIRAFITMPNVNLKEKAGNLVYGGLMSISGTTIKGNVLKITYAVPYVSDVKIKLYDISGRLVKNMISRKVQKGIHSAKIDVSSLVSGVYILRFEAGKFKQVRKIVIMK